MLVGAFARAVTYAHLVETSGLDEMNGLILIERKILFRYNLKETIVK